MTRDRPDAGGYYAEQRASNLLAGLEDAATLAAATEHVASCTLCEWAESWTTREAAEAAAIWHVYDTHHDVWTERMGTPDRLPVDKMPTDYGRRLEPWESQA